MELAQTKTSEERPPDGEGEDPEEGELPAEHDADGRLAAGLEVLERGSSLRGERRNDYVDRW